MSTAAIKEVTSSLFMCHFSYGSVPTGLRSYFVAM